MSAPTRSSRETVEATRESLRSEHKVSLVPAEVEGSAFHTLADGLYGFTYAPASEIPVFQRHSYHSYEVHKAAGGAGFVICYLTASEAELLRAGGQRVAITVYPDAYGDATTLVSIPLDRILNNNYKPMRREGNPISLELAPAA